MRTHPPITYPKGYTPIGEPLTHEPHRLTIILRDTNGEHWTGIFYRDDNGTFQIDKLREPPR